MKIEKITVSAGRTFNHPYESYSNLRPHVQLVATLDDGDDAQACVKALQAQAEGLVEDHKRSMLESLRNLRAMEAREREMARLESLIKESQGALERYRSNPIQSEMPLPLGAAVDDDLTCKSCGATVLFPGDLDANERCEDCRS